MASDLPTQSTGYGGNIERGGYVELDYGTGGNVERMTVRARCRDASTQNTCFDNQTLALDARRAHLHTRCICDAEQHYQYRWDELNRLAEARRYDRGGSGSWALAARQRYRYDSANQRTVKQTLDVTHTAGDEVSGLETNFPTEPPLEAIALYVYPGDYERRGLMRVEGANWSVGTVRRGLLVCLPSGWQSTTPRRRGRDGP